MPAPDDKGDGGGTFRTPASAQPSGRDANFLVRRVLQVELPEDPELAPRSRVLSEGDRTGQPRGGGGHAVQQVSTI